MHAASPRGFAAVARDHAEAPLDLHRLMVPRPAATFFMRAKGDAMAPSICNGDLLVIDRSLRPRDGQVAVVAVDGRWIVRRWTIDAKDHRDEGGDSIGDVGNSILLRPDNPNAPAIRAADVEDFQLFGVVTWVVREMMNAE